MVRVLTPHQWAKDRTPDQWAAHHTKVVVALVVLVLVCSYPTGVFVLSMMSAQREHKAAQIAAAAPARIEGSGVVVSMNDAGMTVQHGPVPAASLAAGTTAFPTPAAIVKRTQVGDQLTFRLARAPGGGWSIVGVSNAALGQ